MIDRIVFLEHHDEKDDYITLATSNTLHLVDKHFASESSVIVVFGKYCSYHLEDQTKSEAAQMNQRIQAHKLVMMRL